MADDINKALERENAELRDRLADAEATLSAIRNGEVDALLVTQRDGDKIYTLESADSAYRLLVENMNEGAVNLLEDGSILYCNQRFAEMIDMPLEFIAGTLFEQYVHPEDRPVFQALILECRNGKNSGELRIVSNSAADFPVHLSFNILDIHDVRSICVVVTDLSEQKLNEQIAADERLARAILDQAAECIVVCDVKGRIIRASQEVGRYYSGNPLLQQFSRVFPLRISGAERPFSLDAAIAGERIQNIEVQIGSGDDNRTMLLNAGPLTAPGQRPLGCVITFNDVTKRKETTEQLRISEDRYRSLFENNPSGVFSLNAQGRFTAANPACSLITGYANDELLAMDFTALCTPEQLPQVYTWFQEALSGVLHTEEIEIHRKDGERIDLRVTVTPMTGNNEITGLYGVAEDVTERKRAAEALRESEERYRFLVQNAASAIMRWRPDGTVTFFNEYAEALFGYSKDEVIGKRFDSMIPQIESSGRDLNGLPDEIVNNPDRYLINVNENLLRDGRRIWMAWANRPIRDEDGNVLEFLSVGTDVTRQKRIEDELLELNRTLEERIQERTRKLKDTVRQLRVLAQQLTQAEEQERGRLAETLHDDIQQLLVASKMHLSLLRNFARADQKMADISEKTNHLLDEAITKTRNLSHELSPPLFSRQNLIESLRWLCAQMKSKHNLNVHLKAETEVELTEPIKIFLFRAAQELLFNIVKHAHVGEAEMSIHQLGRSVRMTVSDRGCGFNPDRIGPSGVAGTGFGLFSIQERIGLLGGWVSIASAPGQGSRFILHVPLDAQP